jgi:hypothetical protein
MRRNLFVVSYACGAMSLLSAVEVRPPLAFVPVKLGRGEWGCEAAGDGKHVTLLIEVQC